jgi:hypothetical protein
VPLITTIAEPSSVLLRTGSALPAQLAQKLPRKAKIKNEAIAALRIIIEAGDGQDRFQPCRVLVGYPKERPDSYSIA